MLYYRQGVGDKPVNECTVTSSCVTACKRGSVGAVKPNIVNVTRPNKMSGSSNSGGGGYYSSSPLMISKPTSNTPLLTNTKNQNIDSVDVDSRSILVAGVTKLISLKRLLQAFQEYDSTGGGQIESFEFVSPESLRITYLYKADADRVLAKSSIFIMDNFVLTISKLGMGRYFNPQSNKNGLSNPVIMNHPYASKVPTTPHLAPPTYTAFQPQQQQQQYRAVPPVESKPPANFFIPNVSSSMASSSPLLVDKRRILLKNVPYSIDKEYLELYLEYLSDDSNEIERYDLLKHSRDSLVVTFLKDIDFSRVKRKHANRPKLLNNRISLFQITLPSTVVLEHVDTYHANLNHVKIESLVDRESVEAYFRRRLRDDRLVLKVLFDKENNWILVKFKRHDLAKRVATSRIHEILKKKFKVKLFYDQLGPDPFSDPPYFFNKEKSFNNKPTNVDQAAGINTKDAKTPSPKHESKAKTEAANGAATAAAAEAEKLKTEQTANSLNKKPVVFYEKLAIKEESLTVVSAKEPVAEKPASAAAATTKTAAAKTGAKTNGDLIFEKEFYTKFALNKKADFFNTDIQSIYDEYDVTASLDSFLNEVDTSQPEDSSFNPRSSINFKSKFEMAKLNAMQSTPKLQMATTEAVAAETSINTNGSMIEHFTKHKSTAVTRDKLKSVIAVVEERVKDLTELNLNKPKPSQAPAPEPKSSPGKVASRLGHRQQQDPGVLDCSFTATSSSSEDENEVIKADIEKYDLHTKKASDLKKPPAPLQMAHHNNEPTKKKKNDKKPIVNLPSLNDPPLSFEEYNMLNYYDKYDKIVKDSKNLTYYNNANSHYNPNGVLHFHLSNSLLTSNMNGDESDDSSSSSGLSDESSSFNSSDLSMFNNKSDSGQSGGGKPVKGPGARGSQASPRDTRKDEEKSIFSRKNFPQEFNKNFVNSYASFVIDREAAATVDTSPAQRPQQHLQRQPHVPSQPGQLREASGQQRPTSNAPNAAAVNPFESSPFQKAFKNINYSSSRRQPKLINGDRNRPVAPKLVQLKIKKADNSNKNDASRPASGPPPPKLVAKAKPVALLGAVKPRPAQQQQHQLSKAKSPDSSKPVVINVIPPPEREARKKLSDTPAPVPPMQNTYDSTEAVIGGFRLRKPAEQDSREPTMPAAAVANYENPLAAQLAANNGLSSTKEKFELKTIKVDNCPYLLSRNDENKRSRVGATKIVTNQYGCVTISQSINRLTPFALEFFQKTKYLNQLSTVYPRLAISLKEKLKSVYLFGPHQLVKDIKAKIEYDLSLFRELEYPLESGDLAECLQMPNIKQKLLKFIEPILIRQQQQKHKEIISEFKKGNELKNDLNDNYIITATNSIVYFCSYYIRVDSAKTAANPAVPSSSYKLVVCTNFFEIGDLLDKYIRSSFKVKQRLEVKSRRVYEAINKNAPAWQAFLAKYSNLVTVNQTRVKTNEIDYDRHGSIINTLVLNGGQLYTTKLLIELTGFRVDVENFITDFNKTFENST